MYPPSMQCLIRCSTLLTRRGLGINIKISTVPVRRYETTKNIELGHQHWRSSEERRFLTTILWFWQKKWEWEVEEGLWAVMNQSNWNGYARTITRFEREVVSNFARKRVRVRPYMLFVLFARVLVPHASMTVFVYLCSLQGCWSSMRVEVEKEEWTHYQL